jgi:hypothetical protein
VQRMCYVLHTAKWIPLHSIPSSNFRIKLLVADLLRAGEVSITGPVLCGIYHFYTVSLYHVL